MRKIVSRYHRLAYRLDLWRIRIRASKLFWSPETLRAHDAAWKREFGY